MNLFSTSCTWPLIANLGGCSYVKTGLRFAHDYIGVPNTVKNPIPALASKLCLNERMTLAFAMVSFGTLFEASAVLGASCLLLRGTYKFFTGHPVEAFQSYLAGITMGATGLAVAYYAKQYI